MRILVLATKYHGVGGAEAYTRFVVRALAGQAEVDVLSLLEGEGGSPEPAQPGRYLGAQAIRSGPWAYARLAAAALRRGDGYDLAVCSHVAVAPIGMALRRRFRVRYVCLGHGIDVWGALGWLRRRALREATRLITVSEFTARIVSEAQGIPRDRISVVYPPVDPALTALAPPAGRKASEDRPRPFTLLTVARLSSEERYKGCDTVIAALPSVIAAAGPLRYVIVGDGDDRARLEVLAESLGVRASVTFAGRVSRDDLAGFYRRSDVFVMPSVAERRPDGWAGEGFGIVYIEAAAFGRPVIAGNGGGAPEAVRDGATGLLVDGRDVQAVAGAITRLATDRALRTRMGQEGQRWVLGRFAYDRFERDVRDAIAVAAGG